MDTPSPARNWRGACARWRRRIAVGLTCTLLSVGAASGVREVVGSLVVPDADGRALCGRWRHVGDPPDERIERAFGAARAKIVAALLPAPAQACWVRPRVRAGSDYTTLI